MLLGIVWFAIGASPFLRVDDELLQNDPVQQAATSAHRVSQDHSALSDHLSEAQKALEAHDLARAKAELTLALKADPGSAEAYVMLGTVDIAAGDAGKAIAQYQHALKLSPNSFSAHYNLGLAYLRDRNLRAGRLELERAVAVDPHSADAAYNLGLVLLELNEPKEAVLHLRGAKSLDPDRPDVAFNLVRAELVAGDADQARQGARDEAKAFAQDAQWNASVGRLFLDSKSPSDAMPYLEAAFRLRPDDVELRRDLALAYDESAKPESALALITEQSSAQDHYLRASAYLLMHRLTEARQEIARALEQSPHEPRYLLFSARIEQHLGQHASALEQLQEITKLAPQWSEPYYSIAVSDYFERRYEDARRSLDQALKLDPGSARSLFLYAATLVNQGKNRNAEDYLRRAIAVEPGNARFEYHLGAVLLRDNQRTDAEKAFNKAVSLKPDYALPHYQLGKILAGQGQLPAAAQQLETAVHEEPSLAQAYYQLSRVYARLGEAEKSTQALTTFSSLKRQGVSEDQELIEDLNKELDTR